MRNTKRLLLLIVVVLVLLIPGGSLVYEGSGGESCTRCHEIRPAFDMWASSAHRNIACADCHGGITTLDAGFHMANLRRLVRHMSDDVPQQVLLVRWQDVERINAKCQECHHPGTAAPFSLLSYDDVADHDMEHHIFK